MEFIIKIKADDDISLAEAHALAAQSRAKNVTPGALAARYLREGIERENSEAEPPVESQPEGGQ